MGGYGYGPDFSDPHRNNVTGWIYLEQVPCFAAQAVSTRQLVRKAARTTVRISEDVCVIYDFVTVCIHDSTRDYKVPVDIFAPLAVPTVTRLAALVPTVVFIYVSDYSNIRGSVANRFPRSHRDVSLLILQ